MRLHITVDDHLVAELDDRVGHGRRSAFLTRLLRQALEDERRWDDIERGLGSLDDAGHEWDEDPGAWVAAQRRADPTRLG